MSNMDLKGLNPTEIFNFYINNHDESVYELLDAKNFVLFCFFTHRIVNNLPTDDVFKNYENIIAYSYFKVTEINPDVECDSCGGYGSNTCDWCDGTGYNECTECEGYGDVSCDSCDGDGYETCGVCYGAGTDEEDNTCTNCYGDSQIECGDCDGRGKVTCDDCDGDGKYVCSHCDQGEEICGECEGAGNVETEDKYSASQYYVLSFDNRIISEVPHQEKNYKLKNFFKNTNNINTIISLVSKHELCDNYEGHDLDNDVEYFFDYSDEIFNYLNLYKTESGIDITEIRDMDCD